MLTPRLGHIKYVLGRAKRQSRANAAEMVAGMFGGLEDFYTDRQVVIKAKERDAQRLLSSGRGRGEPLPRFRPTIL